MRETLNRKIIHKFAFIMVLLLLILTTSGCVFYNTFHNARKSFNSAESERKKSSLKNPRINTPKYKKAIEKSLKVLENYPNSKWYDDALYVIGVSYYYTKQYNSSERRLRELLVNYPESQYVKAANLYVAKSKLEQNEMESAIEIFDTLFYSDYDNSIKAQAAMSIGLYHYENKDYDKAEGYFLSIRDSLGSDEEVITSQKYIADGYYERFKFKDALGAYLQLNGLDIDKKDKYHALTRSAKCSYKLLKVETGIDYINTLLEDELYFDSINVLRLLVADGYEIEDELELAIDLYLKVALDETLRLTAGTANYRLGLTYQFDYDELSTAKEYYDKAVKLSRSSEIGQSALQKSSDIGKLDTYARSFNQDSTTTQAMIDEAAETQYLLAELYWFKLNKPDTAMLEMQYAIDSFSTSFEVPKAMIALSEMYRDYLSDTTTADSLLNQIVTDYPHSDYLPEALEVLGLLGTEADTGYPYYYLKMAEDFIDDSLIDSSRFYYNYLVENFPDSKYWLQAKFAQIWLTEMYESPGDSSIIFAYNEIVDSFPGTYWAKEAGKRVVVAPVKQSREEILRDSLVAENDELERRKRDGDIDLDRDTEIATIRPEESQKYGDTYSFLYKDPEGGNAVDIHDDVKVLRTREEFVFPPEAYLVKWIVREFYFQILLDFSGRIKDYKLMTPSEIDELNIRVERTVGSIEFDIIAMPLEYRDKWMVYKYTVSKPKDLR